VSTTWRDCVQACDDLIETLKQKLIEEPEHGKFWQERIAVAMAKRQEFLVLGQQQENAEITKSIEHIFERIVPSKREGASDKEARS
jgi:hypothetical protein